MKDRIRQVMEYAQLSQQDFAARLGISAPSLSSIFTGRTNPTNNHVMAVHRAFPEVNISWLLFGEGEMLNCAEPNAETTNAVPLQLETSVQTGFSALQTASGVPPKASLFDAESPVQPAPRYLQQPAHYAAPVSPAHTVKNVDKPLRKIKEIRVFYDDGTYESFAPTSK